MRRLALYISWLFALAGCSGEELPVLPAEEPEVAVSLAVTHSGAEDQTAYTYRVLLFGATNGNYTRLEGTYYYDFGASDAMTTRIVAPWQVNATTGAPLQSDLSAGLYAPAGTYSMVIVSPAVAIEHVSTIRDKWGFAYSRRPDADAQPLSVSDTIPISLQGRGELIAGTNNVVRDTVYLDNRPNINEKALRERRSQINFIFRCGQDIESTTLSNISLRKVIRSAWFDPVSGTFFSGNEEGSDLTEELLLSAETLTLVRGGEAVPLPAPTAGEDETGSYLYLLSQNYAAVNDYGEPLHTLPELHVELNEAELNIPLGFNFLPLHRYTYTVTVNSLYFHITLSVTPWDAVDVGGDLSDPPTITVGTFPIDGWNTLPPQSGTIE